MLNHTDILQDCYTVNPTDLQDIYSKSYRHFAGRWVLQTFFSIDIGES
jgi:hypothetical protein